MKDFLKAPFPWFGGKSRVAHLVWDRFGNVPNYVEPFAGSLAVLLARPHAPRTETVNDIDGHLCNFWRAVRADPERVAEYATWPVSECDLHARHKWLVSQREVLTEALKGDPEYFDPKVAGWWVWGLSCWIGSGWCSKVVSQLPHLGNGGQGVIKQLPHLGNGGRESDMVGVMQALSDRLMRVRVACGDWKRVTGPSVTEHHGLTGVFLDPPYDLGECDDVYRTGSVSGDVRNWAIANGENPKLRIALCGYEGEHNMPDSWECVPWKARGGFGSQSEGRGRDNASRERIWFSPYCLGVGLFGSAEVDHD